MEGAVFEYLAAAGDLGIWLVVYGFWRLDKRITILEVRAPAH